MNSWHNRLEAIIEQEPLIKTKPSFASIASFRPSGQPRTVFVGLGLCNRRQPTDALPVDVLGLLLPAELVRSALVAHSLVVLIADTHALTNGLRFEDVDRVARHTERTVARVRTRLGLRKMRVVRASSFHSTQRYRSLLERVEQDFPEGHPYVARQIADMAYLEYEWGSFVKVGWTLNGSSHLHGNCRDEAGLDLLAQRWLRGDVGFIYCEAGRTLNDRSRKAAPYINVDSERRVCLLPDENVAMKIANAHHSASEQTIRGALRYYRAVTSTCARFRRVGGESVKGRLQNVIDQVFAGGTEDGALDAEMPPPRRSKTDGCAEIG
jgi:hypothetical protein